MLQVSGSPIAAYGCDFNPSLLTEDGEFVYFGPYLQFFSGMQDLNVKWILENRSENPGDRARRHVPRERSVGRDQSSARRHARRPRVPRGRAVLLGDQRDALHRPRRLGAGRMESRRAEHVRGAHGDAADQDRRGRPPAPRHRGHVHPALAPTADGRPRPTGGDRRRERGQASRARARGALRRGRGQGGDAADHLRLGRHVRPEDVPAAGWRVAGAQLPRDVRSRGSQRLRARADAAQGGHPADVRQLRHRRAGRLDQRHVRGLAWRDPLGDQRIPDARPALRDRGRGAPHRLRPAPGRSSRPARRPRSAAARRSAARRRCRWPTTPWRG